MKKRRSGTATPVSVSVSETEKDEGVRKQSMVKGSDRPSEPKELPRKQRPEPKAAPEVLKKTDEKEKAQSSKVFERAEKPARERWLLPGSRGRDDDEFGIRGCFFCGSDSHKAKTAKECGDCRSSAVHEYQRQSSVEMAKQSFSARSALTSRRGTCYTKVPPKAAPVTTGGAGIRFRNVGALVNYPTSSKRPMLMRRTKQ